MSICAYCGQDAKLTREHIIPKSLINSFEKDRNETTSQFISSAGGKLINSESTIKDVCGPCNNNDLGKLDAYANDNFTPQCLTCLEDGESRVINYDYDKLARWLLKIGYNSARAYDTDHSLIRPYSDYICGKANRPKKIALYHFGIRPYTIPEGMELPDVDDDEQVLYPDMFRISQLYIPSELYDECVTRMFVIKSIAIVILLGDLTMKHSDFIKLNHEFLAQYPQSKRLFKKSSSCIVSADSVHAWDVLQFHASVYSHLYED